MNSILKQIVLEIKEMTLNLKAERFLSYWSNVQNIILIDNSRIAWPTKI